MSLCTPERRKPASRGQSQAVTSSIEPANAQGNQECLIMAEPATEMTQAAGGARRGRASGGGA
ncbi:hypothetical protein, partial [Roseinatronobacter sp.]|uniref:hypothetical protein n=1 Tax=Roseinatronobacter sp. TaxID=1945755 RepID=UPI0025D041F0